MQFEIDIAKLRSKKIFIATPMYGGMSHGAYGKSIADLMTICTKYGIEAKIFYIFNESLIPRARNYLVDEFMRSGYDYLLFIDSDIHFEAQDVFVMSHFANEREDMGIICAPYPKKAISWEKIKMAVDKGHADQNPMVLEEFVGDYVFNPAEGTKSFRLDEPVEVKEGGTGFMMIKREVFEKFKETYPSQTYRPDHARTTHFDGTRSITAYFDCVIDRGYTFDQMHQLMEDLTKETSDVEKIKALAKEYLEREKTASMRYLSEDYYFCQWSRKMGEKVWLLPWIRLKHAGSYIFGGSLAALASIGASPTAGDLVPKRDNTQEAFQPFQAEKLVDKLSVDIQNKDEEIKPFKPE